MTTKILGSQITDFTIQTTQLSNTAVASFAVALAPKVRYANVANSAFTVLDDTAVNVGGGYIVITGSDFVSGAQVLIDTTPASAVTFVNSTTLRVQVPTKAAASYNLYVVNPDGGVGVKVSGLTYSTDPTWVTSSPLDSTLANTAFGVNLSATGATSYSVASGSTLPAGTSLLANGYFYGTVSVGAETTYSFTVTATDAELQDANKTFSVTVTVDPPDAYFGYTTLLLQADDVSNNSINSSFLDSSNNNLTVTPSGTPIQGSQNPFGTGNWSNLFNGSNQYISASSNTAFALSGDFTVEFWVYPTTFNQYACLTDTRSINTNATGFYIRSQSSYTSGQWQVSNGTASFNINASTNLTVNTWQHVALVRSESTLTLYLNGVSVGTTTTSQNFSDGALRICNAIDNYYFPGYVSNFRILKGTALYTTTFTPSTTPLTTIANTSLLTCQSNIFKDNSNNAFTLTISNSPTVERFNPFGNNSTSYSANTDTGSTYFNGTTDYLTITNNANLQLGSGDWTLEGWIYPNNSGQQTIAYINGNTGSYAAIRLDINGGGTRPLQLLSSNDGSNWAINYNAGSLQLYAWNHFALVRSGSTFLIFINGTQVGTTQSMTGTLYGGTTHTIGCHISSVATALFSGYLSNVKLTKGTALYSTTFTPSTTPLTTGVGTQLLLLSKNAGIYDATEQNNIQIVADAKVRTDVYKYGTGSMYFDGTGDIVTFPTSNQILGTGSFTVEFWAYSLVATSGNCGFFDFGTANSSGGLGLFYNGGSFYLRINGTGQDLSYTVPGNFPNAWHHVAVVRNGTTLTLYIDGVSVASGTRAQNITQNTLVVGGINPTYGIYMQGYLDDFRVTKGYARYTSNFTAPTAKLPNK